MFKVLMVCTGNICRSPIAAGLLTHNLSEGLEPRIEVASAGTHALHGNRADERAVIAMNQIGIDITGHRARQITKNIARESDLILTMEAAHSIMIKNLFGWRKNKSRMISEFNPQSPRCDIPDPYSGSIDDFDECIHILRPCIEGLIGWLHQQCT